MQLQDEGLLQTRAYFDGGWHEADDGSTTPVLNPATGETLAQVSRCGQVETRRAIAAAHRAFLDWRRRTAEERAAALGRLNDLIMANLEDLSRILTIEQGKPLAEARKEVEIGAGYIKWFAEEARRVYGDTIPSPRKDHRLLAIKQPVGVAACITPWNFPNAMLARKLGPALASGCTVVC
ncbi:MAG: aldehyde dehydrogenase family protein, partial [Gammaproteobacteria bacterium]|nr:aldehyde dehydrogenase family protein [Gammaproteobacteria bacterium]